MLSVIAKHKNSHISQLHGECVFQYVSMFLFVCLLFTYRSDSSAACEASESFWVAVASLSSERSKSSSRSWMRRFKAATSPSAYKEKHSTMTKAIDGFTFVTGLNCPTSFNSPEAKKIFQKLFNYNFGYWEKSRLITAR